MSRARRSRSPALALVARRRLGARPDVPELRRLLPPGLGARAPGRARSRAFEAYQAPTEHPLYLAALRRCWRSSSARTPTARSCSSRRCRSSRSSGRSSGSAARCSAPGRASSPRCSPASSFALLLYAARAYVDVPFLAVVLWAGVLEAERPRRGTRASWRCSPSPGCCAPRRGSSPARTGCGWSGSPTRRRGAATCTRAARARRGRPGRLGARRPVGDRRPAVLAARDERPRRRAAAASAASRTSRARSCAFLADALRPPVFLAALAGLALATWRRAGTRVHVPLALLGAGTLAFVVTGVAGPLDPAALPHGARDRADALRGVRDRRLGRAARGRPAAPAVGDRDRRLRRRSASGSSSRASPSSTASRPRCASSAARTTTSRRSSPTRRCGAARACGPVTLPNYRLVPDTRWILDAPRTGVGARSALRRRARRRALLHRREDAAALRVRAGREHRSTNVPGPGLRARRAQRALRRVRQLPRRRAERSRVARDAQALEPLPERPVLHARASGRSAHSRSSRSGACARARVLGAARRRTPPASAATVTARSHVRTPGEVGRDGPAPEPGVLEDPVGQAGVVERLDLERDDARRRRVRISRAAAASSCAPSQTSDGCSRQAAKSASSRALVLVPGADEQQHEPVAELVGDRRAAAPSPSRQPRCPSDTATTVPRGSGAGKPSAASATTRRLAPRLALQVGELLARDERQRGALRRRLVQLAQPLRAARRPRRRRTRSGPSARTRARRRGSAATIARGQRAAAAGGR